MRQSERISSFLFLLAIDFTVAEPKNGNCIREDRAFIFLNLVGLNFYMLRLTIIESRMWDV
jgi:hypothetical protein